MTVIALPPDTAPTVACPSWCTVSHAEHVERLFDTNGSALHHSPTLTTTGEEGHVFDVFLCRLACVDRTPDERDGVPDLINVDGQAMTRQQATEHAQAILRLASEVRP
jgi:hypothetical protein